METSQSRSRGMNVALWVVQVLLFVTFAGTGVWKLATPISTLAGMIPWAGQVSPAFLYFTAAVDLAGGLGVLLPSLTRIQPRLTVFAALGCMGLQIAAALFHLSRGEAVNTPFNFFLIVLSAFVARGRHVHPITPRS